jgi:hypothetical protein
VVAGTIFSDQVLGSSDQVKHSLWDQLFNQVSWSVETKILAHGINFYDQVTWFLGPFFFLSSFLITGTIKLGLQDHFLASSFSDHQSRFNAENKAGNLCNQRCVTNRK